jgi:hypothetical protein
MNKVIIPHFITKWTATQNPRDYSVFEGLGGRFVRICSRNIPLNTFTLEGYFEPAIVEDESFILKSEGGNGILCIAYEEGELDMIRNFIQTIRGS